MKFKTKFTLFLILVLNFTNIYGQSNSYFSISFGGALNGIQTKESSNLSLEMSVTLFGLYIDAASNLAKGEGTKLDFSSNQTYSTNKVEIVSMNFGYAIPLSYSKPIYFTPFVGFVSTYDIYEDFVPPVTYFTKEDKTYFNAGGLIMCNVNDLVNLQIGISTKQYIKFGIGIGLH